jgi:hypothetical protein
LICCVKPRRTRVQVSVFVFAPRAAETPLKTPRFKKVVELIYLFPCTFFCFFSFVNYSRIADANHFNIVSCFKYTLSRRLQINNLVSYTPLLTYLGTTQDRPWSISTFQQLVYGKMVFVKMDLCQFWLVPFGQDGWIDLVELSIWCYSVVDVMVNNNNNNKTKNKNSVSSSTQSPWHYEEGAACTKSQAMMKWA